MNDPQEQQWSKTQDQADSPGWHPDLPGGDFPYGLAYRTSSPGGDVESWIRVQLTGGNVGGRWAYWRNKTEYTALADRLWNPAQPHFIGMLAQPYSGTKGPAWVLTHPLGEPPPSTIEIEPVAAKVRYERSKEVYDVDSRQSHELP